MVSYHTSAHIMPTSKSRLAKIKACKSVIVMICSMKVDDFHVSQGVYGCNVFFLQPRVVCIHN